MNLKKLKRKYFKSTEEVVSMFLGLVIVVVVIGLIFNFFQKKKGTINIPGSTDVEISQSESGKIFNKDGEYVVKKGDSLWKIAVSEYNDGYKWVEVAKMNNLKNPGVIEVGQKIVLPKVEIKEVVVTDLQGKGNSIISGEYKVVKGDSLWKISVRAYGDGYQWVKIWESNKPKIINPNGLEIGMVLTIPSLK
ncbi:MAG: LysM peptidoglycan-binding domain-containing protein [Candidatus Shapirobacteria bacterium]|nr:LysM peptidoglycan-binding domain-containing protein [Candidatus Shapirobacteria bacterium]